MTATIETTLEETPIGPIRLIANSETLVGVYFAGHRGAPQLQPKQTGRHAILDHAKRELLEYLAGQRQAFATPLSAEGTLFQNKVWQGLTAIAYGDRISYAELAQRIGACGSARAVGTANGKNPLSIFVPCHRVIGTSGQLAGYAGGVAAKRWLLAHEHQVLCKANPNTLLMEAV